MPANINLGDNYEIDEDSNGDLVIKDETDAVVLQREKSAQKWNFVSEPVDGVGSFGSESLPVVRVYVDKDGDYVAVGENGEVARDSSDATPVIESAINATARPFNNGDFATDYLGTVRLSNDTFKCDSPITIEGGTRGLVLEGTGSASILRATSSNTADIIRINPFDNGFTTQHQLRDIRLDGNGNASGGVSAYTQNSYFVRLNVVGTTAFGIKLLNDGSRSYAQGQNFIQNCRVANVDGTGLDIRTNDCEVQGGTLQQNSSEGLLLNTSGGTNVLGTHVWGNDVGVKVRDHNSSRLVGCEIEDNAGSGVVVQAAAGDITEFKLRDSDIWQNAKTRNEPYVQTFGGDDAVNGFAVTGCSFRVAGGGDAVPVENFNSVPNSRIESNDFIGFSKSIKPGVEAYVNGAREVSSAPSDSDVDSEDAGKRIYDTSVSPPDEYVVLQDGTVAGPL